VGSSSRIPGAYLGVLLLLCLSAVAGILWWLRLRSESQLQIPSNERSASTVLLILAAAEDEFRLNDREGNGVRDYWTLDVAGLYYLGGPAGAPGKTASLELISREVAAADAAHLHDMHGGSKPYHGYYFAALSLDAQGAPYAQKTRPDAAADRSLSSFAFCAFPAEYGTTGRWTYLINEKRELCRMDSRGRPILRWGDPAYGPAAWIPMK
jgi:hypothetical protein